MPRLSLLRRLGGVPGDRGAVATLVAVMLGGGVLLGAAALAIDVGLIYAEREELQSGADAAAVAVAKECFVGDDRCSPSRAAALAGGYADDNAHDGMSNAAVCGYAPRLPGRGNALSPCGGGTGGLSECLGTVASNQPYVEVRTDTQTSSGGVLPPVFAQTVTNTTGTNVRACSRVSWGPVAEQRTNLAITIREEEFRDAIASGRGFQPPPGTGSASPDGVVALPYRVPNCPGCPGFGFLDASGCSLTLQANDMQYGWVHDSTPDGCAAALRRARDEKQRVPVAIFDRATSGHFHVTGIAVFVVTGWYSPPGWAGGPAEDPESDCVGNQFFCLYGYFTTRVFEAGPRSTLGDDHFGAVHIRTIG